MATVYVNDKPVDIGTRPPQLHPGGRARPACSSRTTAGTRRCRVVASCRMCLVEVGEQKDGKVVMQPQGRPRLPDAGQGRHRHRHRQRQGRATPRRRRSKGCCSTTRSTARSATRPASACCRTSATSYGRSESRMVDEKNTPPNKPDIGDNDHAVHRPLHHVHALRPLHPRDQRHRRAAGHQPRRTTPRSTSSPASRWRTSWPATSSTCARSGRWQQGLPLQAARLVPQDDRRASAPTARPAAAIHVDAQQGHRLPPAAAREPAGAGLLHVRRGPATATTTSTRRERHHAAAGRARTASSTPVAWARGARRQLQARRSATRRRRTPRRVVGVLSPFLTCEEAYLLAKYLKGLSQRGAAGARAGAGRRRGRHVPEGPPRQRPVEPVKFTIRAEKCPNRRGVEEVLRHFQGEVRRLRRRRAGGRAGELQGASTWRPATRRDRAAGSATEQAEALAKVPLLVVQDLFPSPAERPRPSTSCRRQRSRRRTARSSTTPGWPRRSRGRCRPPAEVPHRRCRCSSTCSAAAGWCTPPTVRDGAGRARCRTSPRWPAASCRRTGMRSGAGVTPNASVAVTPRTAAATPLTADLPTTANLMPDVRPADHR